MKKSIKRDKIKFLFSYDDEWIEYQYKIFLKYVEHKNKIYEYDGSEYSFEEFLHFQDWNRFQKLSFIKIPQCMNFDFSIPFDYYSGFEYYQLAMDFLHKVEYRDCKQLNIVKSQSIKL
jgi:hypothetical protein